MLTVSCHWIIIICIIVLLAAHPTLEKIVRAPSSGIEISQVQEKQGGGNVDMYADREDCRPTKRDNLSPSVPQAQHMPSPGRIRKAKKLRRKRDKGEQRSEFVFPDQLHPQSHKSDNRQFVIPNPAAPPPCARKGSDTFCESVDEYPTEHVLRVLRKEPIVVRTFFHEKQFIATDDDVQDRIDASDENPLCAAQEHIVYPKMAKNNKGDWLFVINHEEYIQGVRVEKCLNDRECSFPASLPIGYRSQCKQKYIYRKLVALNGTGQGVISDSFLFPSCCSCVIKLDHSVHSRLGGSGGVAAALPLTLPKTTPTPLSLRHTPKSS